MCQPGESVLRMRRGTSIEKHVTSFVGCNCYCGATASASGFLSEMKWQDRDSGSGCVQPHHLATLIISFSGTKLACKLTGWPFIKYNEKYIFFLLLVAVKALQLLLYFFNWCFELVCHHSHFSKSLSPSPSAWCPWSVVCFCVFMWDVYLDV